MLTSIAYYIIFSVFGFVAMYLLFAQQVKQYIKTLEFKHSMLTFPYFYGFYALSSVAAYFLSDNLDFVEPLNWYRLLCPLLLAPLIYAAAFVLPRLYFILLIICSVAAIVMLQPLGIGSAFPQIPFWAQRLLLIVIFSVFCLYTVIFNFVPHIYVIFNLIICAGISLLGFIGAAPFFLALIAGVMFGVLTAYLLLNYYEVKISIDDGSCVAFSFLISNLLLLCSGEFSFSSCLIFTAMFWPELLLAVWRKTFINHNSLLSECTNYYEAAQKYNAIVITFGLLKIGGLILLLGWLQLFATNSYSLLIVALIFTAWLNTSMGQGLGGIKSFKQINKDFIADVKQNLHDAKEAWQKKDK